MLWCFNVQIYIPEPVIQIQNTIQNTIVLIPMQEKLLKRTQTIT